MRAIWSRRPFAASLLADFGADVIKDRAPAAWRRTTEARADQGRNPALVEDDRAQQALHYAWISSKSEGADIFKDMIRTADAVVENYRPGTLERWGLGYDQLKAINPRLVLLRISGFGQTGPYRDRPAFGRIAEAISGLTNLIGEPDGPPMSPGYPLGDLIAGLFGAFSVMTAIHHRDAHRGEGQVIDLALNEAIFRLLDFDAIQYDQLKTVHRRTGNRVSYVAPSSTFKTGDGKYITLAASTQSIWLRVCKAIEREELISDPRYHRQSRTRRKFGRDQRDRRGLDRGAQASRGRGDIRAT